MKPNPDPELLFGEWMGAHRGILLKITRSFSKTPEDAADLEQELMLRLWISIPRFEEKAKASTWIYRVCLNTALSWQQSAGRRVRRLELGQDLSRFAAAGESPAAAAQKEDLLEKLYASIRALPQFDRSLVLLLLDGLSYREISEVTGLKENHVGVALTRARGRLVEIMKGVAHELE